MVGPSVKSSRETFTVAKCIRRASSLGSSRDVSDGGEGGCHINSSSRQLSFFTKEPTVTVSSSWATSPSQLLREKLIWSGCSLLTGWYPRFWWICFRAKIFTSDRDSSKLQAKLKNSMPSLTGRYIRTGKQDKERSIQCTWRSCWDANTNVACVHG